MIEFLLIIVSFYASILIFNKIVLSIRIASGDLFELNGKLLERDEFFICLGDVNCETVLEVKDCVKLPGNDNVHCVCPNCGVLHEYDLDLKKVVKISSLKDKKLIDNGL